MKGPEKESLVLRADTQDMSEEGTHCARPPSQDSIPVTQTSCISSAGSNCTQSQITQENDLHSQYSSADNVVEPEIDKNDFPDDELQVDATGRQDSQGSTLKTVSHPRTKPSDNGGYKCAVVGISSDMVGGYNSIADDYVKKNPNYMDDIPFEDFEVEEMNRSFVRTETCEDNHNREENKATERNENSLLDLKPNITLSQKRKDTSAEHSMGGEKQDDTSDSDQSEDDQNDELKEVLADEDDDGFNKGPEISLPYKEPEQLSLQEFLARRRSKRASVSQQHVQQQSASIEHIQTKQAFVDELQDPKKKTQNVASTLDHSEIASPLVVGSISTQRKSKLHTEILKAAAKVTPQLSCSGIIDTPVDKLIQRAIIMNKSIQDAGKVIDPTPGSQLKDLKDRLKVEIIKQRRRIRMERASAVQNNDEAEEEYEEMTDNENDCDPDDEETLLDRVAKESDAEDEERNEKALEDDDEVSGEEGHTNNSNDEQVENGKENEDAYGEDEASDIEDFTLRKLKSRNNKTGRHRVNAVQDSDDGEDLSGPAVNTPDDELNLRLDDDEEDAKDMRLSQTQKPKTQKINGISKQKQLSTELFADDLTAEAKVDDDLLALCSGEFVSQKEENGEGNDHEDESLESYEAVGDANSYEEDDEIDDEVEEELKREENEELKAYRKLLTVENSEEDSEDQDDIENDDNGEKEQAPEKAADFFEGEAELSGSDVGSDDEDEDNMTEDEKRRLIQDLISENPGISDEQLEEQVKRLHAKYVHADDQKELRMYKEMLLADGDLHEDGPGRERRFRWTNLSNDFVGGTIEEDGSDCDINEETEEEAKWKARRMELEKKKKEQQPLDYVDGRSLKTAAADKVKETRTDEGLNISRVLRDANKALKIAYPKKNQDAPTKRPVSGGFLNMTNSVLERIADKVKGSTTKEKEGSQTTKNFVFRTVDRKREAGGISSNKRPGSESPFTKAPNSKKAKVDDNASRRSSQSVFNKF